MSEDLAAFGPVRALLFTILFSFAILAACYFSVAENKYVGELDKTILTERTAVQLESTTQSLLDMLDKENVAVEQKEDNLDSIIKGLEKLNSAASPRILREYLVKHLLFVLKSNFDVLAQLRGDPTFIAAPRDQLWNASQKNLSYRVSKIASGALIAEVAQLVQDLGLTMSLGTANWNSRRNWLFDFAHTYLTDSAERTRILSDVGTTKADTMDVLVNNVESFERIWDTLREEVRKESRSGTGVTQTVADAIEKALNDHRANQESILQNAEINDVFIKQVLKWSGVVPAPERLNDNSWKDFYIQGAEVIEAVRAVLDDSYSALSKKIENDMNAVPSTNRRHAVIGSTLQADTLVKLMQDESARSLVRRDIENSIAAGNTILEKHTSEKNQSEDVKNGSFEIWGLNTPVAYLTPFGDFIIAASYLWFFLVFLRIEPKDSDKDETWFLTSKRPVFVVSSLLFALLPVLVQITLVPGFAESVIDARKDQIESLVPDWLSGLSSLTTWCSLAATAALFLVVLTVRLKRILPRKK